MAEAAPGAPDSLRRIVFECASGALPATIAAMRLLMESTAPNEAEHAIRAARAEAEGASRARLDEALALIRQNPDAFETVKQVVGGMEHGGTAASPEDGVAYWASVFDRAAAVSPEGSVALYSLGSPQVLRAATDEIVSLLRGWGLLAPHTRVLDLGCGIGRLTEALAPEVAEVAGLDISEKMIEVARARLGHLPNVRFVKSGGRELSGIADRSVDLVLAVDVFPYLVQSGLALAERHVAEAARVLRPGGSLVVLNFSYRGDLGEDGRDLARMAEAAGFGLGVSGERPFRLWDGAAFHLVAKPQSLPASR